MAHNNTNYSKGFTTTWIHENTGISLRKLRYWDQEGLVKPKASPDRKNWKRRLYTLPDIVCLLVINALRENGVSLRKIKDSVERIEVTGIHHPLAKLRVACLAQTVIFKKSDGTYVDPISGQMVIKEALELICHKLPLRHVAPAKKEAKTANRQYAEKVVSF
jgi:DNA-binding transcriptional MerR regulator